MAPVHSFASSREFLCRKELFSREALARPESRNRIGFSREDAKARRKKTSTQTGEIFTERQRENAKFSIRAWN
jgi:hypothetical protein